MKNIKILVSCHKESYVPENKLLIPIQVGAKGKRPIAGMLRDDEGENISEKNPRYCEMTAQYWAWKNLDADYYGFFHYRRYLSFSEEKLETDLYNNVMFDNINQEFEDKICLSEDKMREFIGDNDIIVPFPMNLRKDGHYGHYGSVYNHYVESPNHDIKDFEKSIEIIKRLYPECGQYADEYANSAMSYFLNMYIMKKEIFYTYCEWVFPILDEFDAWKNYTNCNNFEYRTPGLVAERLFGIYFTYLKATKKDLKVKEAQQCFINDTSCPYVTPAFEKNNIPVCLAPDNNYSIFASVVIQSIISNSNAENNYDLIILGNKIEERNKANLLKIVEGLNNFSVRFINADRYIASKNLYEKNHINSTAYIRLGMLDFLKNYSKAIYLDCDLVVNTDIAELFKIDLGNNMLGAVVDTVEAGWCRQKKSPQREYNINVLKLKKEFEYFNSGVLLMDLDKFRKETTSSKLISQAQEFKWMWQDQDILNMLCEGKTLLLEQSWNVMVHDLKPVDMPEYNAPQTIYQAYLGALKNPKIVHYAGRVIPTFAPNVDLADVFWKYARQSIFYEKILCILYGESVGVQYRKKKFNFRAWIIKTFFPKNTKRREFAKRIYYKLKGVKYSMHKK
ncbi:MAG: DUF4422 domain-containing protein [Clostridia bacterium]|nr:DUF4422 domain-containing protein [Clostridia bacterium]